MPRRFRTAVGRVVLRRDTCQATRNVVHTGDANRANARPRFPVWGSRHALQQQQQRKLPCRGAEGMDLVISLPRYLRNSEREPRRSRHCWSAPPRLPSWRHHRCVVPERESRVRVVMSRSPCVRRWRLISTGCVLLRLRTYLPPRLYLASVTTACSRRVMPDTPNVTQTFSLLVTSSPVTPRQACLG